RLRLERSRELAERLGSGEEGRTRQRRARGDDLRGRRAQPGRRSKDGEREGARDRAGRRARSRGGRDRRRAARGAARPRAGREARRRAPQGARRRRPHLIVTVLLAEKFDPWNAGMLAPRNTPAMQLPTAVPSNGAPTRTLATCPLGAKLTSTRAAPVG